jgi:hypothetical protein
LPSSTTATEIVKKFASSPEFVGEFWVGREKGAGGGTRRRIAQLLVVCVFTRITHGI